MAVAKKLVIVGLVQGVGFRPFIHRIAAKYGLAGYVRNIGGSEVEAWIEGDKESIERFMKALYVEKPPPAIIEEVRIIDVDPMGYKDFKILPSSSEIYKRSNIPPDLAICEECLREILDPGDRRHRYAFNSCAWCGPRFSMMYRAPYDRSNTSMARYRLCSPCMREYTDIANIRRYHAQGISCPGDGPRLALYTADMEPVETSDPLKETARLIDEGYIVAIKGIGGYHIAVKASMDEPVENLRKRKKRPRKPFAVMTLDVETAGRLVELSDEAIRLLRSPERPILLLPKRENSPVSPLVSPGLPWEGVFTAYTGIHYLILMETRDKFAVMTSGNITGEPMCIDEKCVSEKLSGIVDYVLTHDREIVNRVDDSVIRWTDGERMFLRRSRGYAPLWIRIKRVLTGEYIAFGADLHSVAGIGFEDKIVLTQYIGELDSLQAQIDLVKYLGFFVENYHVDPGRAVVVVDKHPEYASRRLGLEYAEKHGSRVIEVQHHYAHVIGAAYDNGLEGRIAGLAIDGLGWGDDDTIWGGEIIVFDTDKPWYKRVGRLKHLALTSDRDTYYPARLVTGYLAQAGYTWSETEKILRRHGLVEKVPGREVEHRLVYRLVHDESSYIRASSTGRLLDMVSVLTGTCDYRSYEGEPAVMLEARAYGGKPRLIDGLRITGSRTRILDYTGLLQNLLDVDRDRVLNSDYIASILYSIGYWLGELMLSSTRGYPVDYYVASGGAAVNTFIIKGVRDRLREDDLELYLPRRIPSNDGGIAFGQIVSASLHTDKEG